MTERRRPINNVVSITISDKLLDLLDKYEQSTLTPIELLEGKNIPYSTQVKRMLASMLTNIENKGMEK